MTTAHASGGAASPVQALQVPLSRAEELAPLRRLSWRAAGSVGAVVLVLLAWSALAPISGAVIAPGVVKTELDRKTIRHQEGGIVREVLVREGQQVKAGDPLLLVGDVRTDALLDLQQDQWNAEAMRHARLEAELAVATSFVRPQAVKPTAAAAVYENRERVLFDARRRTMLEQQASLQAQVDATQSQVAALTTQIAATRQGLSLAREELGVNRSLVEEGFVQRTRVLALERAVADYEARAGEQAGELALARQRLADFELRRVQVRNQYQQQAATELKDSTERLRGIEEQLRPARDTAERQYVRAPVDGEVMSLKVAAPGAVIGPRDVLLEVVPTHEAMVVEARIAVEDIEHVRPGAMAEVRLSAYEYRAMPLLQGRVAAVSADRVEDPRTGLAWFSTRIEVDASGLTAYAGAELRAGMPAEAYVTTEPRSLLEYVLRPFSAFARRGMREP
jgi:HlyD family type I secretion membrane fusion protein